jgi:1-deoxy-D-xylulose-5-phosphate reductoisomerase
MKHLAILGSTGSIGKNVLDIVSRFPDLYSVKSLAAATNVQALAEQIERFRPDTAVVIDRKHADELKACLKTHKPRILFGEEGYKESASHPDVRMVVSAIVGAAGLIPTVSAILAGKDIALANKETLVTAGDYVMNLAREKNVRILPVDSEQDRKSVV